MSSEFLSQDEVDSLLKGVSDDEESAAADLPDGGVRPYDLAKQDRIVRGRMPTLEIINERFARNLRTGLFKFMRKSPEISVTPVKTQKYGDFIRNLDLVTNLNVVSLRPLRGNALFIFEPALVFTVVDYMFGGDNRFHNRVEGREFTATEQRIIARMLEVVLDNYKAAWHPVHPVNFEFVRAEMHAQFASVATASDTVVTSAFRIELGAGGGDIHVCIPYGALEPIRDLLYRPARMESSTTDNRWMRMLTQQVQLADVELVARLARTQVTLQQVLNMKAGDIIGLELKPTLTAEVDGVPIFDCRYGVLNGQYSIKIDKILAIAPQEQPSGDDHVH